MPTRTLPALRRLTSVAPLLVVDAGKETVTGNQKATVAGSGRGCVKTSARFHTSLFRSLLRGLRAFRVEKIEKNLALLDRLQNFAEFLHGLGPIRPSGESSVSMR
jgi:hypothetical protein